MGAADCKRAVADAVAKAQVRVQKETAEKKSESEKIGETYVATTQAPLATPAPVIRVCRQPAGVLRAAPTTSSTNETPSSGTNNQEELAFDWDTTPIVTVGRDADAQIKGLQDYITHVCLRR